MATLSLSRRFDVAAAPERVWGYLVAPELVVHCLPGAALVSSSEDGRTHEGTVTVSLGSMSVSYRGSAEFEEVDESGRRLSLSAKGREKTGAGSAEMTLQAAVLPSPDGSVVDLEVEMSVTGKIVTLGRGMIGIVTAQVMSEFIACLTERLASGSPVGAPQGATADSEPPAGSPSPSTSGASVSGPALLWRALRSFLRRLLGG